MADNVFVSNAANLAKYMALDQKGKVLAEYIWIDGSNGLRNKTKVSNPSILFNSHCDWHKKPHQFSTSGYVWKTQTPRMMQNSVICGRTATFSQAKDSPKGPELGSGVQFCFSCDVFPCFHSRADQ